MLKNFVGYGFIFLYSSCAAIEYDTASASTKSAKTALESSVNLARKKAQTKTEKSKMLKKLTSRFAR